jgi:hypothetical protein
LDDGDSLQDTLRSRGIAALLRKVR